MSRRGTERYYRRTPFWLREVGGAPYWYVAVATVVVGAMIAIVLAHVAGA